MKLDDSILVFDIDLFLIMKLDDPIFMCDINLFLILQNDLVNKNLDNGSENNFIRLSE